MRNIAKKLQIRFADAKFAETKILNRMKSALIFALLFLCGCLTFPATLYADNAPSTQPIKMEKRDKLSNSRPTDAIEELTCEFSGGRLYFEFQNCAESCNVDVTRLDTNEKISLTGNSGSTFTITMGNEPGFYEVTVNTQSGDIYIGYFSLD